MNETTTKASRKIRTPNLGGQTGLVLLSLAVSPSLCVVGGNVICVVSSTDDCAPVFYSPVLNSGSHKLPPAEALGEGAV